MSQNQLGRVTAMDAATIKGVVGRLVTRRLVTTVPSEEDRRRLIVDLTPEGRALFAELRGRGAARRRERTLAPLSPAERERFLAHAAAADVRGGEMAGEVRCVAPTGDVCGEGAVWAAAEGRLYWTDINRFLIHAWSAADGSVRTWMFDEPVVALALTDRPGVLLVALASRLILFTPESDGREAIGPELPGWPAVRFNDGRPDPLGRMVIGTMGNNVGPAGEGLEVAPGLGRLYRFGADRAFTEIARGIGIANTVCWSPDARTFYFADTMANEIRAYAFDPADGTVGAVAAVPRRVRARRAGRVGGGQRGIPLELPLRRRLRGAGFAGRRGGAGGGDAVREHHHLHLRGRGSADALHHHGGGGAGALGAAGGERLRAGGAGAGAGGAGVSGWDVKRGLIAVNGWRCQWFTGIRSIWKRYGSGMESVGMIVVAG